MAWEVGALESQSLILQVAVKPFWFLNVMNYYTYIVALECFLISSTRSNIRAPTLKTFHVRDWKAYPLHNSPLHNLLLFNPTSYQILLNFCMKPWYCDNTHYLLRLFVQFIQSLVKRENIRVSSIRTSTPSPIIYSILSRLKIHFSVQLC